MRNHPLKRTVQTTILATALSFLGCVGSSSCDDGVSSDSDKDNLVSALSVQRDSYGGDGTAASDIQSFVLYSKNSVSNTKRAFCYYIDQAGNQLPAGTSLFNDLKNSPQSYGGIISNEGKFDNYCDNPVIYGYLCGKSPDWLSGLGVSMSVSSKISDSCSNKGGCDKKTVQCNEIASPEPFCYYLDKEGQQMPAGTTLLGDLGYSAQNYFGVKSSEGEFSNYCTNSVVDGINYGGNVYGYLCGDWPEWPSGPGILISLTSNVADACKLGCDEEILVCNK